MTSFSFKTTLKKIQEKFYSKCSIFHNIWSKCSIFHNIFKYMIYQGVKRRYYGESWGVFNNASAWSAITCFLSECKSLRRHLQVLVNQLDRCFARNSNMATKTIMGFRERLCTILFQIRFLEWQRMFLCVGIYELEQFKLKVKRCFTLLSNQLGRLICLLQEATFFFWASTCYHSKM